MHSLSDAPLQPRVPGGCPRTSRACILVYILYFTAETHHLPICFASQTRNCIGRPAEPSCKRHPSLDSHLPRATSGAAAGSRRVCRSCPVRWCLRFTRRGGRDVARPTLSAMEGPGTTTSASADADGSWSPRSEARRTALRLSQLEALVRRQSTLVESLIRSVAPPRESPGPLRRRRRHRPGGGGAAHPVETCCARH